MIVHHTLIITNYYDISSFRSLLHFTTYHTMEMSKSRQIFCVVTENIPVSHGVFNAQFDGIKVLSFTFVSQQLYFNI